MFTRRFDDPEHIEQNLRQQTMQPMWNLDVPFTTQLCFPMDPQIIPQKFGNNLYTNCTDIQSTLLGYNAKLNRDCITATPGPALNSIGTPILFPNCSSFLTVEESRAVMPAWELRDMPSSKTTNMIFPPTNVPPHVRTFVLPTVKEYAQDTNHVFPPFETNMDTRDYYMKNVYTNQNAFRQI
jgi:hypothetical protein